MFSIAVMSRRNLKCNQAISEINNNAVKFRELQIEHGGRLSYTGHVALFSSCSPLIFSHADKTTELAAKIIPVMILRCLHTDSTYLQQIPMTVFSPADEREGALASAETTDDEWDTDCESFGPTDLLRFAWQIARGMVSKILFIN